MNVSRNRDEFGVAIGAVDETVGWLRERAMEGQLRDCRTIPGHEPRTRPVDTVSPLESALADRGIDALYAHQARAIEATRDGQNVVLATPTASGKSLAYTVPAFERAMESNETTLYVAPQVALINDQAETLSNIAETIGFWPNVDVATYTGRLSDSAKRNVRDDQPEVLLTTPDMLHYGILPHGHRLWDWFLERLKTIVVDEVHEYRGVFGSHVALVFRRLARLFERFGTNPDWICCSATIGNPVEHAATVTGQPSTSFALVEEDASATGPTHWCFWNPPVTEQGWADGSRRRSSHIEAKRLFCDLLQRGHQTVVFTRSRQTAERYATESSRELRERGDPTLAGRVEAYQAALSDDRRAEIESGLKSGDTRGVWSTNALELGVDVGELDCVILDGYPGTRMSAYQQAGRAGRGTDPSLVMLIAGEDQLDQFYMSDPQAFFDEEPEEALSNPKNRELLPSHVRSAAREAWLQPTDDRHFGETFSAIVQQLESNGLLDRRSTRNGIRWIDGGDGSPQHEMSLRTVSDRQIQLRDRRDGSVFADLPFDDGLRDAHPGAVYHHQGQTYEVHELDVSKGIADCEPTWADYFTRALTDKQMIVEQDNRQCTFDAREDVPVRLADVTLREQVIGFERRDASTGERLETEELDLPETTLRTEALYYTVPDDLAASMREVGDFEGGIHAAEHAMIAMFPTELLCDRGDIGGLSTPVHPHTDSPTIFIYDGYPGGIGLTSRGYERIDTHAQVTLSMLRACTCDDGCPACVQSPQCGNANSPLDKETAKLLLGGLT